MTLRRMLLAAVAVGTVAGLSSSAIAQTSAMASAAITRATSGHLQPGDRVYFKVWRELLMSDTVFVDERGNVLLPKVGSIHVTSMTVGEIPDSIRHRFSEFYRDSPVEVIVLRRVVVNGGVARSGVYHVDVTTRLRDLIARAGGVTDVGDPGDVSIVRDGQPFRVRDWQEDHSSLSDLQSGDEVVVGKRSWFQQNIFSIISVSTGTLALIISLARR